MDSEDTLFYLYTSGSTGKPKGIAHTTAGYLLFAAMTHYFVFDHREGDVYACMADIGYAHQTGGGKGVGGGGAKGGAGEGRLMCGHV